ncbi:MAG: hypothetical protein FGM27_08015 [Candidatus Omnitrophica bacterium]|nr:hypothetical protein [Candidatus Omnitrophota bacterium]
MSRELSGVIACLQQIEIAAARLEEAVLIPVKKLIQEFFRTADVEKAREILEVLEDLMSEADAAAWREREIEVDGVRTYLQRLTEELAEVLEDLG